MTSAEFVCPKLLSIANRCFRVVFLLNAALVMLLSEGCTIQHTRFDPPGISEIYDHTATTKLSLTTFYAEFDAADVIYLAEQHDNPYHHFWQKEVLKHLSETRAQVYLGLEVFPYTKTSILLSLTEASRKTSDPTVAVEDDIVREKIDWGLSYDEAWKRYGELIMFAYKVRIGIFGIDLPLDLRSRVSRLGINQLTPLEQSLLFPSGFENSDYRDLMFAKFKRAHCNWGDNDYFSRLYDNWIARNDTMANAIVKMASISKGPIVVVLGAGHTEYNMGVYERVKAINPRLNQINVGLIGVEDVGHSTLSEHSLIAADNAEKLFGPRYDYFWFTSRYEAKEDPCKAFLKKKEESLP